MHIFSGIEPGNSGVGQLMSALVEEAGARTSDDVVIHYRGSKKVNIGRSIKKLKLISAWREHRRRKREAARWESHLHDRDGLDAEHAVLIHPQSLGVEWCQQFIERRSQPTWIYLMDCSYFCVRSYNHLDHENESCLRCVGGDFSSRAQHGCKPYPAKDEYTPQFLDALRRLTAAGKVRYLTQNQGQTDLARAHFGADAVVHTIGLWTADMGSAHAYSSDAVEKPADVVFHGHVVAAKGVWWAFEVARKSPELSFLFPCSPRVVKRSNESLDIPPNCRLQAMSWDTGLAEEITAATVTLVPSLWSASIEGAIIKSLLASPAVAVVNNPSAFSAELPADLLLRLDPDTTKAAAQLQEAVAQKWRPDAELFEGWRSQFVNRNRQVLQRIVDTCKQNTCSQPQKKLAG